MKRIGNILEAISQLANAVLGGYPDEMLSARAWRTQAWYMLPLDLILGKDHCKKMYDYEWSRKSKHPHYN